MFTHFFHITNLQTTDKQEYKYVLFSSRFCPNRVQIQCLETSSRFTHADKAKGVKRLLFSPQYIERKISIFNETINRMKEYKHILYNFRKVPSLFKTGLITMFSPIFSLLEAYAI